MSKLLSIVNKKVKFKVNEILPKVFYIEFNDRKDLTSTLLRFQEHYESPKFRNKIFSLKEFAQWYSTTRKGRFTYFSDWSGFNFPSYVLKPFYEGKFDSLTVREKQILEAFKEEKGLFYIIATYKNKNQEDFMGTKKHEIAHSQYYLNKKYYNAVNSILKNLKLKPIFKYIKSLGYHKSVFLDEAHAYLLTDSEALVEEGINISNYSKAISALEKNYKNKVKV